jgi:integrase
MTPQWLDKLSANAEGEWVDSEERGLRLRVRSGLMVWSVRYLSPMGHVRYTIGEFPAVGLAKARQLARVAKGAKAEGKDKQAEKREERQEARQRKLGETVKGAVASWLKDRKAGPVAFWKGGLGGGTARSFTPHVNRLVRDHGDELLVEIEPATIERFVTAPEAANTRNHALTVLRLFLAWARRKRLATAAKVEELLEDVKRERTTERARVLVDEELRTLVQGFDATRYGRAVRLLALTGLRRHEVLAMEWDWLDTGRAVLTIPREADKSGKLRGEAREVPLSDAAVALLAEQRAAQFAEGIRSNYVFATSTGERPHRDCLKPILYRLRGKRSNGTTSRDKRAKKRTAELPADVTIHDVRRTVSNTLRKRLAVPPAVVDFVVLGHTRPKLLRTYMPELPIDEARPGLNAWAAELARIVGPTELSVPARIVPAHAPHGTAIPS